MGGTDSEKDQPAAAPRVQVPRRGVEKELVSGPGKKVRTETIV